MNLTLRIWRQKNASDPGRIVEYPMSEVNPDMSFLEMLDVLNEQLIARGEDPVAFDSDCREGICGMCSLMINGVAHGGFRGTATPTPVYWPNASVWPPEPSPPACAR